MAEFACSKTLSPIYEKHLSLHVVLSQQSQLDIVLCVPVRNAQSLTPQCNTQADLFMYNAAQR